YRPDHPGRAREAPRVRLRAARSAQRRAAAARRAPAQVPVPVLRLDRHEAREPLRPDAVPPRSLLQRLPPAVRAVQGDLNRGLTLGRRCNVLLLARVEIFYCPV